MKKKGFTLIELLAVIVILAVIALIATPLIMNVINDARKNSFKDSAYGIIKAVEFRASKEQMDHPDGQNKEYKVDVTSDAITYSGDKPTSGWAHIDQNGNIELYMCNTSYCASKAIDSDEVIITSDSTEMETIKEGITRISELDVAELTKDGSEGGHVKPVNNCTFDGELTQGAEYVNGQYTYRYMQEKGGTDWENITADGWGVSLTDKTSTDPVTTKLCTSINGKPIVSMAYMFGGSKASSIDASSFDTSNVANMYSMFGGISNLSSLDLSSLDTSNVSNMKSMFSGATSIVNLNLNGFDTSNVIDMSGMFAAASSLTNLDLSGFDTSHVTNMSYMFNGDSSLTSIDLSNFNTSNVTNMDYMLGVCSNLKSLNLSNFDFSKWQIGANAGLMMMLLNGYNYTLETLNLTNTKYSSIMEYAFGGLPGLKTIILENIDTSNVTNMHSMFNGDSSLTSIDLSGFNTSNVTNMGTMFYGTSSLTSIDLSSFDTSKVLDTGGMFVNTGATIGYARTQADADKFNASDAKPSTLTFTVK